MPIKLLDIRTAVQDYLNMITATIHRDTLGQINPGETFSFSLRVINTNTHNGGIRLVNIRYHLETVNPTVAKLIVPPLGIATARSGPLISDAELSPGMLVSEMFLFPMSTDNKVLDVDEHDSITGLTGMAGNDIGNTEIRFNFIAEPDLDYIFPKHENGRIKSMVVPVV